ncbi:hypothetical protein P167DRAFT_571384 [Morchella conica CCBAS932]|uniref:Uncharacterized protein n=1 Tax=Morchella conica CCBAS932 TaxID=1392247 RepID=A0A3N4L251_9PEZI|nr:hypothetical protein P167DRAFT_571384 [Morchella conica CCBAS932]
MGMVEDGDFMEMNEHLDEKLCSPINTAEDSPQTSSDFKLHPASTEPKKTVLSSSLYYLLTWHIGNAISIPATAFFLYLNLSEYSIDPRVGLSHAVTSNIIGALQLLAKLHELMMITSLVNITRQWILRSLLDSKGTPLGLVGAELSMMNGGYLISDGYLAAVKAIFGCFGQAKDPERNLQRRNQGTMLF